MFSLTEDLKFLVKLKIFIVIPEGFMMKLQDLMMLMMITMVMMMIAIMKI